MNIQDPNQKIDCFACRGKGYFLLWTWAGKQFVTRQSYLTTNRPRSGDAYTQIDCGECNGTGVFSSGEVKY